MDMLRNNKDYDDGYKQGSKDTWEIIRQLENRKFCGIYVSGEDLIELFGTMYVSEIVKAFTPSEVSDKVGEWVEKKCIVVGDVVEDAWNRGVVTLIDDDGLHVLCNNGICEVWGRSSVTRTGEHIDLNSWFERIGGGENGI